MADIKRTSEYRKLLPFIARASGDVGGDTIGEDVQALLQALNTHKTSGDHDGRYYTETETNALLLLKADKTITLTAGDGLTGGGNLSANRTFDVGAGDGIVVTDNLVSVGAGNGIYVTAGLVHVNPGFGIAFDENDAVIVDLTENYAWTGNHSFTQTMYAGSIMPHNSDTYDLGSSASLWRKIWGSELSAVVFSQYEQVLLGGWFTISKGEGVLSNDVISTDIIINLGAITFEANDILVFRGLDSYGNPQVEYLKVVEQYLGSLYVVTRNLDGSGANDWQAGTVFANYGSTGDGRIELNAYDEPRLSVFSHASTIAGFREQVRIGDLLNGWGYSASTYGAVFGAYEPGKANITIDPTNGIRLRNYNTNAVQLDGTKLIIGELAVAKPNVLIDSNGLYIRNYTTEIIKLTGTKASFENVLELGTNGRLQQGTGTWGTDFTGSAIWNDSGVMNIGGWKNNVKQWWGGSDGKLYADGGDITLDRAGIKVGSSGIINVRISRFGVELFNHTTSGYQPSSIAFISTREQDYLHTIGRVHGYSVGYENFIEVYGRSYDIIIGAVSNVEVRAISAYNAHAKLAATMPGVGDDAYLSVNMNDGDTAIATSIDLFADRVNVKNGVVTYGGGYPEYRQYVYTGFGEASVWKRVAVVTIGVGTYAGASFIVEWIVGVGVWGQSQPRRYVYDVRCVRSGSTQDDTNAAYIEGNDSTHLRVVKTATGVFEIQVRSGYQYCSNQVKIKVITASRASFDFGVATAGSGTIYAAKWKQANRVVVLDTPTNPYTNKQFNVNTTTTYDANSYGVPTTAKAIYIRTYSIWQTASSSSYLTFEKYGTSDVWLVVRAYVSGIGMDVAGWVALDDNGRFNVKCFGASTMPYCGGVILAYME